MTITLVAMNIIKSGQAPEPPHIDPIPESCGPADLWDIINFSKLFKLKPVNTQVSKKFNVTRSVWDVEIARLPCVFSNETSLRILPKIFEEI